MCSMEEKLVSCELSFYPLGLEDYNSVIEQVLNLIENSNLIYEIGHMSTLIRGDRRKILNLIEDIDEIMRGRNKYVMNIKISNVCGC